VTSELMTAALRLLARGAPVPKDELAAAADVDVAEIDNAPGSADIEYDDEHRIVGWGLTLIPTPHRFTVDGRRLYTWCAGDTLMFPAIIGRPAQVESHCPTTDVVIRLTVDPQDGVTDLSPATAVISIPGELDIAHVRDTCCNPGRFFASAEAAAGWRAKHPDGSVVPVADAYPRLHAMSSLLFD
jgi:alkylmercury lyase